MQHISCRFAIIVFFSMFWLWPAYGNMQSQTLTYSEARLFSHLDQVQPGEQVIIALELRMRPGWHVYWKNPGDTGLAPTIHVDAPEIASVSDMIFQPPERIPLAHLINYGYHDRALFLLPMNIKDDISTDKINFSVQADWLICQEDCVPESAKFQFSIDVGENSILCKQADIILQALEQNKNLKKLQGKYAFKEDHALLVDMPDQSKIVDAYFFIEQTNVLNLAQKQLFFQKDKQLSIVVEPIENEIRQPISGILEIKRENNRLEQYYLDVNVFSQWDSAYPVSSEKMSLYIAFTFAILGGILLNIMPCVFPILSLKVLSLLEQNSLRFNHRLQHVIAYSLGILFCFSVIALILVGLKSSGMALGWGFQMQSPWFLLSMIYLMTLMALVLSGIMPFKGLSFSAPQGSMTKHPLGESFFTGLLITLVSTPCTAPFMAPALGFALTQSSSVMVALIIMIGVGLALPFIFLALMPGMQRILPKPGPWLEIFKEFLAFPMMLTAIWLMWLLQRHISHDMFTGVLVGILALALWGWTYKHSIQTKWLKYCLYILIVMPIIMSFYQLRYIDVNDNVLSQKETFDLEYLDSQIASHRPVFVNVTADWCINCKVNEQLVLSTKAVQSHFEKNNIKYIKVDWTHKDSGISQYLARYNRFGVPLYVYYPENGTPVVLPQILTQSIILQNTQPKTAGD